MAPWTELAAAGAPGAVLVLTGAGISAESGIPTFRGPEGYWRIGSREYQPEKLATYAAFTQMPDAIWSWYLYRRAVCAAASPNVAHRALAELAAARGDRCALVTQNVDGLHRRAGHDPAGLFEIHGNLDHLRCAAECRGRGDLRPMLPLPAEGWAKGRELDPATAAALHCDCGAWLRPHVLWFDESYDEQLYHYETALTLAMGCSLLLVVGTSGATSLPAMIVQLAASRRVPTLVVNREPSPFSELAVQSRDGVFLQGDAGDWVPRICAALAN